MIRARHVIWSVVALFAFGALMAFGSRAVSAGVDCSGVLTTAIVVDTGAHPPALCDAGKPVETFSVRLGRDGVGKTKEGDKKTPLGHYPLARPQSSSDYGTFIPIGYPTDAQRRNGYTGSAVGVHGPHRRVRWLGRWVNVFDTTDGCVGIATDDEMERVAAWVKRANAREIVLR